MKKIFMMVLLVPFFAHAQRDWSEAVVETSEIASGIYRLFVDNRVAVVAFTGPEGVLLIDAAYEQTVPQLKRALEALSAMPVRYLVNTHIHGDHTGGNEGMGKNAEIIAHHQVRKFLGTERRQGNQVIPAKSARAIPNITFSDGLQLAFNGQLLEMTHLPEGHTNSDIIVYFPLSEVLVVGDLLFAGYFPYVDTGNGGHPMGYVNNMEKIIRNFPPNTTIIGGHGPVYTMSQYKDYHQTLLNTIEVVRLAKKEGMSAAEIKEKRILRQWESMGQFFITEDRWIDTLFPYL